MWNKLIFDAGNVPPHATLYAYFIFEGEIFNVFVKGSCGCGSVMWDPKAKTVTAIIHVDAIPHHLTEYHLEKYVTVRYDNNNMEQQTDVLTIRAFVK